MFWSTCQKYEVGYQFYLLKLLQSLRSLVSLQNLVLLENFLPRVGFAEDYYLEQESSRQGNESLDEMVRRLNHCRENLVVYFQIISASLFFRLYSGEGR